MKNRRRPQLWQSYLWYNEFLEQRKRHLLRISATERGDTNLDVQLEKDMLGVLGIDHLIQTTKKTMINYAATIPVWEHLTGIKGLGEGALAAIVLAHIDDISQFSSVSKLWRYSGYAVIDGGAEPKSSTHYNRRLKSALYLVSQQFIWQQTPGYIDVLYEYRARQRELHPEPIQVTRKVYNPTSRRNEETLVWKYNDAHLLMRARRKVIKVFLQHLWLRWRIYEGLPISMPYVIDHLNHVDYISPESCGWPEVEYA